MDGTMLERVRGEVKRIGLDLRLMLTDWDVNGRFIRLEPGEEADGRAVPLHAHNKIEFGGDMPTETFLGMAGSYADGAFYTYPDAFIQQVLVLYGMVPKNASALASWTFDNPNEINFIGWARRVMRLTNVQIAAAMRIDVKSLENMYRPRITPAYRRLTMAYLERFGPLPYGALPGEAGPPRRRQITKGEERHFLLTPWIVRNAGNNKDVAAAILGISPKTVEKIVRLEKKHPNNPELADTEAKQMCKVVAAYYESYGPVDSLQATRAA